MKTREVLQERSSDVLEEGLAVGDEVLDTVDSVYTVVVGLEGKYAQIATIVSGLTYWRAVSFLRKSG